MFYLGLLIGVVSYEVGKELHWDWMETLLLSFFLTATILGLKVIWDAILGGIKEIVKGLKDKNKLD